MQGTSALHTSFVPCESIGSDLRARARIKRCLNLVSASVSRFKSFVISRRLFSQDLFVAKTHSEYIVQDLISLFTSQHIGQQNHCKTHTEWGCSRLHPRHLLQSQRTQSFPSISLTKMPSIRLVIHHSTLRCCSRS